MKKTETSFPLIPLLILAVVAGGGYWAYRNFGGQLPVPSPMRSVLDEFGPTPELPLTTSLTNRENKTITATVLGRTADQVQLIRQDDPQKKVYSVPLATFNDASQKLLNRLPIVNAAPVAEVDPRQQELAALQERVSELTKALDTASSLKTPAWRNQQREEIAKAKDQIRKLQSELRQMKSKGKPPAP